MDLDMSRCRGCGDTAEQPCSRYCSGRFFEYCARCAEEVFAEAPFAEEIFAEAPFLRTDARFLRRSAALPGRLVALLGRLAG